MGLSVNVNGKVGFIGSATDVLRVGTGGGGWIAIKKKSVELTLTGATVDSVGFFEDGIHLLGICARITSDVIMSSGSDRTTLNVLDQTNTLTFGTMTIPASDTVVAGTAADPRTAGSVSTVARNYIAAADLRISTSGGTTGTFGSGKILVTILYVESRG